VSVGRDGRVHALGRDISVLAIEDTKFAKELEKEQEQVEQTLAKGVEGSTSTLTLTLATKGDKTGGSEIRQNGAKQDGKLVVAEEMAIGRVHWKTIRLYVSNMSQFPFLFLFGWIALAVTTQGITSFSTYFIARWGDQYETHDPKDVPIAWRVLLLLQGAFSDSQSRWLGSYSLLAILSLITYAMTACFYFAGAVRASQIINDLLVDSVLGSTLRYAHLAASPVVLSE